jgi:hypothetical protein
MCVQCSSNEDCKSYKCVDGFCEGEEAVETEKTEGGDEKPSGCCCSCFGLIIPTLTALAGVTLKNMA